MRDLKKLMLASCFAAASLPALSAVFVVAHPDDHILLMGPNMINDIASGYPTVVVIVTAGDAGNGITDKTPATEASRQYNAFGNQYYRVRLHSHMSALDKWVPGWTGVGRQWAESTENFGTMNPRVEKWALGNVVLYHLNLPDASTGSQTYLQSLWTPGTVVRDIQGINQYTLPSLKSTIQQIISRNNRSTPNVVVNRHYELYNAQHEDHPDHTATGLLVKEILDVAPYSCVWQAIYRGYQMGSWPANSNLLESQRSGYELAHTILAQHGNVTPYDPQHPVQNPAWMQATPVPGTTDRQYGAMDGFHTGFYGKSYSDGAKVSPANCAF